MKSAYQRGWWAGWQNNDDKVAAGMELANKASIPITDYSVCAEDELRFERELVDMALEEARYLRKHADEETAERASFERIPEHLREGVTAYVDEHRQAGHFLTAVFMGDLHEAMRRADLKSRGGLFDLCAYLHNYAPASCYGSRQQVTMWLTPTIPILNVKRLGGEVAVEGGRVFCPRCGGTHLTHHATVNRGEIKVTVAGESMAQEHQLLYVWCGRTRLEVVAIDGREWE